MVAYRSASDPIKISDLGYKVKGTVIKNVSQNEENDSLKIQMQTF